MTPRKILILLRIAGVRRREEMAELLAMHALAARGNPEELKKQLKRLGGE